MWPSNLWNSFIHYVSLSSLVEVFQQVLCGLLPLLDSSTEKTRELFKFLLEENLDHFQVPYLMFLPTLPLLKDIVVMVSGEGVEFKEAAALHGLQLCRYQASNTELFVRLMGQQHGVSVWG